MVQQRDWNSNHCDLQHKLRRRTFTFAGPINVGRNLPSFFISGMENEYTQFRSTFHTYITVLSPFFYSDDVQEVFTWLIVARSLT